MRRFSRLLEACLSDIALSTNCRVGMITTVAAVKILPRGKCRSFPPKHEDSTMTSADVTVNSKAGQSAQVECRECKRRTNHGIECNVETAGTQVLSEDDEIQWNIDYQIVRCRGCDTFAFR